MTFLNPLILAGLLAISIPILIHLLNLNKVKKIEFSTLRFLKELQKSKMRRIKLRQLLLLALRVLAIVFLVFAFADPVIKSSSGNYSGKSTSVIILDNSFSMSADEGKIFENARSAARKVVNMLDTDDEIYFLTSSELGNESVRMISADRFSILRRIDSAAIALKPFNVSECLINASLLFANSAYTVKDLFLISDFQKNNFDAESKFNQMNADEKFTAYLVNAGKSDLNNMSLDSAAVNPGILAKGMNARADVILNNVSQFSQKGRNVKLFVNGNYAGEGFTDVGSYEKEIVEQTFEIEKPGISSCEFTLEKGSSEDDELLQDNRSFFVVDVPVEMKIALVSDESESARFVELALEAAQETAGSQPNASERFYDIQKSPIVDEKIMNSEAVIIAGRNDLSESEARILDEFVSGGGGLIVFPGNNMNADSFNDKLLAGTGALRLGNKIRPAAGSEIKFETIDFEHPVFRGIFRNKSLSVTSGSSGIESPEIIEYYKVTLSESGKPIIVLNNGDPFLSEIHPGKGRILLSSLSLSNSAGDFASKSIFVPLIVRSVNYISGNSPADDHYYVGSRNIIRVSGIENVSRIIEPSGRTDSVKIELNKLGDKYFILPYSNKTGDAGIYKAVDSSGIEFAFALNTDPRESDLRIAAEKDAREFFSAMGLNEVFYSAWDDIDSIYSESKQGSQLWKYFLILALLMLAAEKFLSRKLEKGE